MSSNGINEIKKFLANYGTKWIKDADTNKDSAVTKNEFSHFIQTNYNGKISASEINAFFDTLDINKGNGCARGTNVSNYGALDKDETEVMQKYIEMFDKVKKWLNEQNLPADIANDVKNALLDKMSEYTTAEELQGLMNESNLNRLINETYANKYVNEYLKELFLNTASQYEDLVSLGKYAYADDPELVAIYSQIIYDASNTTERLNPQDLKNQIRTAIKAYVDTILETGESGARIELNAIQKANITLTAIRDSYDTVYDEDGNAYVLTDPKYSNILNKYQKLFTDRLCSNSERKTYAELMAEARNFENSQECKDMIAEIKAGNNSDGGSDTDRDILVKPILPGNGSYGTRLPSGTDLGFVSFTKTSFTVSQANQTFNNVYSWADDTKDNYINVGGGYSDEVIKFSGGTLTVNATALNAGTHTIPVTVKCCNPGESTPIETKTINIKLVVKESATRIEDNPVNTNVVNFKATNFMLNSGEAKTINDAYTWTNDNNSNSIKYIGDNNGLITMKNGKLYINAIGKDAGSYQITIEATSTDAKGNTTKITQTMTIIIKPDPQKEADEKIDWDSTVINGIVPTDTSYTFCTNYEELKSQGYNFTLTDISPSYYSDLVSLLNDKIIFAKEDDINGAHFDFNINCVDSNGNIVSTKTIYVNPKYLTAEDIIAMTSQTKGGRNKNRMTSNLSSILGSAIPNALQASIKRDSVGGVRTGVECYVNDALEKSRATLIADGWTNGEINEAINFTAKYFGKLVEKVIDDYDDDFPTQSGNTYYANVGQKYGLITETSQYVILCGLPGKGGENLYENVSKVVETTGGNSIVIGAMEDDKCNTVIYIPAQELQVMMQYVLSNIITDNWYDNWST